MEWILVIWLYMSETREISKQWFSTREACVKVMQEEVEVGQSAMCRRLVIS